MTSDPGAVGEHVDGVRSSRPEVARIVTACTFAIATGRWTAGDPVPSVRRGAELWHVSPATVHQAYQLLCERGVLRSESRRGCFVRDGRPVEHLVRHAAQLSELYASMRRLAEAHPGLSPVGVFRHALRLAERDATADPEVAFVECTLRQALRHASEIESRLGLPCLGLDLRAMDPQTWEPPAGLRVLLTTAFHAAETERVAGRSGLRVVGVPLACCPDETRSLSRGVSRIEIRSIDPQQGRLVAEDIRGVLRPATPPRIGVRGCTIRGLESELGRTLGSPTEVAPGVRVVLSMYLWEAVPEPWRRTGAVHPYPYRIDPAAWPDVATQLGLPLAT